MSNTENSRSVAEPSQDQGQGPRVVELWIAREAKGVLEKRSRAHAVAGRGLEGDRYYHGRGSFDRAELPTQGRAVTLIERQAIDDARAMLAEELGDRPLDGGVTRRNIVVQGVFLQELVGARFRLGSAILEGIRLAPPCKLWQRLAGLDVLRAFKGRGGLRADILESGEIHVGDRFELIKPGRGRLPD